MRAQLALVIVGAAVSGCGSLSPPAPRAGRPPPHGAPPPAVRSPVAEAQAMHEYPGPTPPRQSAPGTATVVQAIREFAVAYINWTAQTVSADMEKLAQQSVGQARSATELAAAQTGSDYELRRGGVANSGTVEAVAPLSGRAHQYVVVTRERTTATATTAYEGLQPAWHVAVATVAQVGAGRWAVSGWQPES